MNKKSKLAKIEALQNAAEFIRSHGEEGGDLHLRDLRADREGDKERQKRRQYPLLLRGETGDGQNRLG